MYLKLKMSSYKAQMMKINEAILQVFLYLASCKRFRKDSLRRFLGADREEFYKQCERTVIMDDIRALAAEPPAKRWEIYRAMEHDLGFEDHIEDAGYQFLEQTLGQETEKKLKRLMEHLYKNAFQGSGICADGERASYKELRSAVLDSNRLKLCPVCLELRNLGRYGEMDHYLPRKNYPLLTFHPDNLAVSCHECNAVEKRSKNPLAGANMTEIYFPYHRAAEEETRIAVAGKEGKKNVKLLPGAKNAFVEKRIRNLQRLYSLDERWEEEDKLSRYLQELMAEAIDRGLDESAVIQFLERRASAEQRAAALHAEKRISAACCVYFAGEGRERFLGEWQLRRRERERLENPHSHR